MINQRLPATKQPPWTFDENPFKFHPTSSSLEKNHPKKCPIQQGRAPGDRPLPRRPMKLRAIKLGEGCVFVACTVRVCIIRIITIICRYTCVYCDTVHLYYIQVYVSFYFRCILYILSSLSLYLPKIQHLCLLAIRYE